MSLNETLYGVDLFGDPIENKKTGPVAEKFGFPPFSVLDARSGDWQNRKRAWISLGIAGEVGRESPSIHCPTRASDGGFLQDANYTSIFDPVLCECVYRWFCPAGGQIIDPFAGGSVRGVVASALGFPYIGIDLSKKQIAANKNQVDIICIEDRKKETVKVKISTKWLRHMFLCSYDYITDQCHGRCCEGSDKIMISLLPQEEEKHRLNGKEVIDGFLQPDPTTGKCPYKTSDGLCSLHGTGTKPFGCVASPFKLNENNTLVIRNRYSLMKCHGLGDYAYKVFRASLNLLFGVDIAENICNRLDNGEPDFYVDMSRDTHKKLVYLEGLKRGISIDANTTGDKKPIYLCGDAIDILDDVGLPNADFIFSCPPYGDLEKYSDNPRDLSNMEWHTFVAAYGRIILKAVQKLKQDRFACFVVGDFRDKKGFYRDFVSTTISHFKQCGLNLYNEAVLITSVGSASMRVTKQFNSGRKFAKTHQNVLIFCKGDWKKAVAVLNAGGDNA